MTRLSRREFWKSVAGGSAAAGLIGTGIFVATSLKPKAEPLLRIAHTKRGYTVIINKKSIPEGKKIVVYEHDAAGQMEGVTLTGGDYYGGSFRTGIIQEDSKDTQNLVFRTKDPFPRKLYVSAVTDEEWLNFPNLSHEKFIKKLAATAVHYSIVTPTNWSTLEKPDVRVNYNSNSKKQVTGFASEFEETVKHLGLKTSPAEFHFFGYTPEELRGSPSLDSNVPPIIHEFNLIDKKCQFEHPFVFSAYSSILGDERLARFLACRQAAHVVYSSSALSEQLNRVQSAYEILAKAGLNFDTLELSHQLPFMFENYFGRRGWIGEGPEYIFANAVAAMRHEPEQFLRVMNQLKERHAKVRKTDDYEIRVAYPAALNFASAAAGLLGKSKQQGKFFDRKVIKFIEREKARFRIK